MEQSVLQILLLLVDQVRPVIILYLIADIVEHIWDLMVMLREQLILLFVVSLSATNPLPLFRNRRLMLNLMTVIISSFQIVLVLSLFNFMLIHMLLILLQLLIHKEVKVNEHKWHLSIWCQEKISWA